MIATMYITLMPVILAGIGNMLFTKTFLYKKYAYPIDKGRVLSDGKRVFGQHKTGIGFVSMIIFCALIQCIWGAVCQFFSFADQNMLYETYKNTFWYNLFAGGGFGFAYMICELPNSFIKRRLGIADGKTEKGAVGVLFFFADQLDSIIGVVILLGLLTPISAEVVAGFIVLGGVTHITVNGILFLLHVRKNL